MTGVQTCALPISTDVVAGRVNKVSSGFWVDGNYAVSQSFFTTSSTQVVITGSGNYDVYNGLYYYNVYYLNQPHFSIAYGDYYGSGSSINDSTQYFIKPTKSIYDQYKNVLLTPDDIFFNFKTGNLFFTMNQRDTDTLLLVIFGWLSFVIVIAGINLVVAIVKAVIGA